MPASEASPPRIRPGRLGPEDAARRHRRVLDAARQLFIAHGLNGTSFNAIAREANITKRTIYLQFENKEGLFVEVLKDCVDSIAEQARQPSSTATNLPSLLASIVKHYEHALDNPDARAIYRLAVGESARLPESSQRQINLYGAASAFDVIRQHLQQAERNGWVTFLGLEKFVHLFLNLVLTPRFCRWLLGDFFVVPDDDDTLEQQIHRFLRATSDLHRSSGTAHSPPGA